jgi:hypothetical protein
MRDNDRMPLTGEIWGGFASATAPRRDGGV